MSKLADRIRKAALQEPAPLGFGARAQRTTNPTLLVIVRLGSGDVNKAEEALKKGADAVLVDGADSGKAKDAAAKGPGLAVGVRPSSPDRKSVASLRDAGADFVVLDAESASAEAMLEEKIGFVLDHLNDTDDTGLRVLGELGLDAMIIPPLPEKLSLAELLKLRRVAALTRVPLLAAVKSDAEPGYLQSLRDSGVAGVIVESSALGKLADIKSRIESLPARGRRREERAEAVLPAATPGHDEDFDDDD
jgi:hypothetical protein